MWRRGENCLKRQPLSGDLICRSQVRSKCGHVPDLVPALSLSEGVSKSSSSCSVFSQLCAVSVTSSWKRDFQLRQDSPKDREQAGSLSEVLEATTNKQLRQGTQGSGPSVAEAGSEEEHFTSKTPGHQTPRANVRHNVQSRL